MSARLFPYDRLSQQNIAAIFTQWSEICDERGVNSAIIGIMQLVLDRLRRSCHDSNGHDFELSERIDLDTFDMKMFVSEQTENKMFSFSSQKESDKELAPLFTSMIEKSNEIDWVEHIQRFLRVLLTNEKTAFLVTKTSIFVYTTAVMLQNESNSNRQQLQQTCHFMSSTISEDELELDVLEDMIDAFFEEIDRHPDIIQRDMDGCTRIITQFLEVDDKIVNNNALTEIIEFGRDHPNGIELMRLCAREAVIRQLSRIIRFIKGIKTQSLALQLACLIQEKVRGVIFEIQVYQDCIRSENGKLQQLVANLTRLSLRHRNREIANPAEVLIRAVEYHQRFRQDYSESPQRMINTFYTEFTNFEAVFEAIQLRLPNQAFINEMCYLLKSLFTRIKNNLYVKNREQAEQLMRSFVHSAIDFLENLDRRHMKTYGNIMYMIVFVDKFLSLSNIGQLDRLANIVSNMSMNYFSVYEQQMSTITLFSRLVIKGIIHDDVRRALADQCMDDLNSLQAKLQGNVDYDTDPEVLQAFMRICVLVWHKMVPEHAVPLCKQTNALVMTGQLDLTKNRAFLAYNLHILVDTCTEIHAKGNQKEIQSVSRTNITKCLLEILKKTENDLDFLCVVTFCCLAKMELRFKSVSLSVDIKTLVKYVLKKVSLVEIMPQTGINLVQLENVRYMLDKIELLLNSGRTFGIRELVVILHKRFPAYDFALNLMKNCAKRNEAMEFANCVDGVMEELITKKMKVEFMNMIKDIIPLLPNENAARERIIRMSIHSFGQHAQEQHDADWQKRARHSAQVIGKTILAHWSLDSEQ